jgi:hypothetical protein
MLKSSYKSSSTNSLYEFAEELSSFNKDNNSKQSSKNKDKPYIHKETNGTDFTEK